MAEGPLGSPTVALELRSSPPAQPELNQGYFYEVQI